MRARIIIKDSPFYREFGEVTKLQYPFVFIKLKGLPMLLCKFFYEVYLFEKTLPSKWYEKRTKGNQI